MVIHCAFKKCTNKSYKWALQSFHTFPLRDPERTQLWLLASGLDINTPAETLHKLRLCSDHFRPDDFAKRTLKGNKSLTTIAVPSIFPGAPTATYEQEEKTLAEDDNPLDQSMSSFEASSCHPVDRSFDPLSSTASSSSSDIPSAVGAKNWSEKKWIVNESNLMQIFTTCHQCGVFIEEEDKKVTTSGTRIHIKWSCMNGHSGEWESCPQLRGMPENNLLVASAILFTGSTYTEIFDWAELLNLQIPKKTTFYSLQSTYLIPVIEYAYRDHHEDIMRNLQLQTVGGGISICGDGRSDSPGFSAKYTTYSFMSDETKEIIMVDLIQLCVKLLLITYIPIVITKVTEATSSPAMETLGFRRGLDRLLQAGVGVDVITTDRSPSIRKLMRETYSDIQHQFDPWHVAKGLKKKLTAAANTTKNNELQPWLKAITNHLWWSCQSCGGDAEASSLDELKRRWTSILHHICGIHRWEEDGQERTCYHQDLTEEQQRRKKWLQTDSAAFKTLSDHVLNKTLLKDLNHMTFFKHTGALEVYHSSMLKYTEKRLHFVYSSMKARTLLSVMDHNENVGRQQATTTDGTLRYDLVFPKQTKRWVARKRYEPTRQTFRKDLVERVLERRQDPTVKFADPKFYIQKPPNISDNIATTPRPDKEQSIAEHVSRFKT
ncbi:THAP domain-containing protein 4 [Merluccius polli]|uniref:THAP domain-containing protein 4 n=1 Tax=Merluccius polli TaxID=89951 RepID=A0AA47M323_MERPO|nr:THAP domain-containing protein 4 [Merluccius polli]